MARQMTIDKIVPWLEDLLREFGEDIKIVPDIVDQLRDAAELNYEENFLAASDSRGSPWPPHSPNTVARYGPHDLLILEGHLLRSLAEVGAPHSTERHDDYSYSRGTDIIYAKTHNYGRPGGGWNGSDIPQREFAYVNDRTVQHVMEIAAGAVVNKMQGVLAAVGQT